MNKTPLHPRRHQQRDIWVVDFSPQIGRELMGPHACVILQRNEMNNRLPTTIVAPLIKSPFWRKLQADAAYGILVKPTAENGLDQERWIDISQISCIEMLLPGRVVGYQGTLEVDVFWEIEKAFYASFGDLFSSEDNT